MLDKQSITQDNLHQKVSGIGFVVGAFLLVLGSLLLPRASDLSDVLAQQKVYAEQATLLQGCALLLTFGFWAILIGISGIYHSVRLEGAVWVRLGFYFHLIGVTLWTMGMTLDISYPAAITNWLASPAASKDIAYSVVTVLSPAGFGRGTFPMNVMVNWLAFTFFGIGMIHSSTYPRWLGWYGVLLGISGLALGIVMTFTGREALINVFVILMLLSIVWWLTCGIWVLRKAMVS
ncbi:MAG: hypothetical protein IPP66_17740 [Anaerolineales bacterium]|nr:hypothetical protein [Anaerolineales bacterium]